MLSDCQCRRKWLNGKAVDLKKNVKVYVKAYKLVDGKKVAFGKTITAKKAGKCTICVYAKNGYAKKVTVTVK